MFTRFIIVLKSHYCSEIFLYKGVIMLEKLILEMFELGMIKFGEITLKSGQKSYVYADVRTAISYPIVYKQLCDLLYAKMTNLKYDFICGVPYSALTFASGIAYAHAIPQLLKRKETKEYGTKKILEGDYIVGQTCVLIEDVVTSGASILDTSKVLEEHGLIIKDIIIFLNRNQGGTETLVANGYNLHSIVDLPQVLDILAKHDKINAEDKFKAMQLIEGV